MAKEKKKNLENLSGEGIGVRGGCMNRKEGVMSTEMPLLGFLAEMKTHKSTCTHTQTHVTSRCWRFMRGQKNRLKSKERRK